MEILLETLAPGAVALLHCGQPILLAESAGRAAGALSRGHVASRQRDLLGAEVVLGLLPLHGSPGWGCSLPEDQCCWVVGVGEKGQCKPFF